MTDDNTALDVQEDSTTREMTLAEAMQLAMRWHQTNQFHNAEQLYRILVDALPGQPDVLHYFGLLRHQRGFSAEGVQLIKQALEVQPDYIDALNNLGIIYLQTGQPILAEECFSKSIAINPDVDLTHANLGIAYKKQQKYELAIASLEKASQLDPKDSNHFHNLGKIYQIQKDFPRAVEAYNKALQLKPFDPETTESLVYACYRMGEKKFGLEILERWLAHEPEHPVALHLYAAYTGANLPARASDDYVKLLFDSFAASFDSVLYDLDYLAPELVSKALQTAFHPDPGSWRLLDAGCGTGLCGVLVRPTVQYLVGVDLSQMMLEKANARGIYDELIEGELTAFLEASNVPYDAITCVDTLCYFGDLQAMVKAASKALKPGGCLIFTVEKLDEKTENPDFLLNIHGRYSHKETYVRRILEAGGFEIKLLETAVLRQERQQGVDGLVLGAYLPLA